MAVHLESQFCVSDPKGNPHVHPSLLTISLLYLRILVKSHIFLEQKITCTLAQYPLLFLLCFSQLMLKIFTMFKVALKFLSLKGTAL